MKRTGTVLALVILVSSVAVSADRMTDRNLGALVNRIDEQRGQYEDALEGKLKSNVLRTAKGEVDVSQFLDDFEVNVDRLKERMGRDYAASAEVGVVLQQASIIDAFFRKQTPGTGGESEWNRLSGEFKTLAAAYNATFPLIEGGAVRRMSRREVVELADQTASGADAFKNALDNDLKKDPVLTKEREPIVREADELKKDAEAIKSRVDDDQPSTAEVDRFFARDQAAGVPRQP